MGCRRIFFAAILFAAISFAVPGATRAAQPAWQANIPGLASEPKAWSSLLNELQENGFRAGTLAAATRMLMFFTDLQSKEAAYKAILALVDQGYPFSVLPYFQAGDLSPSGDYEFVNSYNLYKAVLNRDKGLERWAKQYMEGVDTAHYRKFVFLEAIEAYSKKDYKAAEEKLKSLLSADMGPELKAFARKVARTLARTYFDQEQYAKALSIYSGFLLKTAPVDPHDWLEAAWCLYYLKRIPEALGMLYNLESEAAQEIFSLEKFTLRALIYRNQCAVSPADLLVQSFQKEYGDIIRGLKRGRPLSEFPKLAALETSASEEFQQIKTTLQWLNQELPLVKKLSKEVASLAAYVYNSEILMLNKRVKLYSTAALEKAAVRLIMMDENLRFLKFSVQREKYNPDTIFKADPATALPAALSDERNVKIRWLQHGDFWRDERLNYEGAIPNRCFD